MNLGKFTMYRREMKKKEKKLNEFVANDDVKFN